MNVGAPAAPWVGARTVRVMVVIAAATVCAAVDQWVKASVVTQPWAFHHRSPLWFVGSWLVVVATPVLALLPSRTVAAGAALLCGGALGNLLSASTDGLSVPNPLVLGTQSGVAFNVADVCILAGNLILVVALGALMISNRDWVLDRRAAAIRVLRRG